MKNFVFISPNFPDNYWRFCAELKKNGLICPLTHTPFPRMAEETDKVIAEHGIVRHPHKNMRKTWETAVRWEMKLPPWLSEPLMGHKLPGVTARFYDSPSLERMADVYAEGYLRYPFGEDGTTR